MSELWQQDILREMSEIILYRLSDPPPAPTWLYQSPIERIFAISFRTLFDAVYHSQVGAKPFYRFIEQEPAADDYSRSLFIVPQFKVGTWPVDYLFIYRVKDGERRLVVECDGHDFHERTKEQAMRDRTRDRDVQAAGMTIFRFTGSEIFRSPSSCIAEVLRWVEACRDEIGETK